MNQDQIFNVLTELLKSVEEPERPEGHFLASEYGANRGISSASARVQLRQMALDGLIEPVKFKVRDLWGDYRTRNGWKVVEGKLKGKRK